MKKDKQKTFYEETKKENINDFQSILRKKVVKPRILRQTKVNKMILRIFLPPNTMSKIRDSGSIN